MLDASAPPSGNAERTEGHESGPGEEMEKGTPCRNWYGRKSGARENYF